MRPPALGISDPQRRSSAAPGSAPVIGAGQSPAVLAGAAPDGPLGIAFPLLLVWLFFEFGRPPHPFGIPLLISIVSFLTWVTGKDKQWAPYTPWWFVLLVVMVIGVGLSENTYAAFWATKGMAVLFLTICLPLQSMVTSVKRLRMWLYTLLAVAAYICGWAALHGGKGPSAGGGGQDENYIAAMAGLAIGVAYFSWFAEKRMYVKVLLGLSIVIFVAAIANGENPSRGGFLGLCTVGLYCVWRSPRRMLGFGLMGLMGVALLAIAGPAFWAEIATSSDYQSGTGDVRLEIWKCGLRMWQANPLFGVGPDNFRWEIGNYQSAEQFAKFGRSLGGTIIAHSLPVEMVAEVGTAGAIATAVLILGTWRGLGKVRDDLVARKAGALNAEAHQLRCYADAIRVGLLAILVNGVFLSLYYYSHLWLLIAVGSAIPFVYRRMQLPASGTVPALPRGFRRRGAESVTPAASPIAPPTLPVGGLP